MYGFRSIDYLVCHAIHNHEMCVNKYCIINFALRVCTGYTEVGYSPPYNIMNSW